MDTMPQRRLQFSLRTALLVMTLTAVVCAVSRAVGDVFWILALLRTAVPVAIAGYISYQLLQPGPKLEGIISVGAIATFHGWYALPLNPRLELPQVVCTIIQISVLVLFVTWFAFAVLAIRRGGATNRKMGVASLFFLLSSSSLHYLEYWQFLVCTLLRIEWWHMRPLRHIRDLLWLS